MMTTNNTGNLRRSSIMPGKGQPYKKPMKKKMKTDPYAEGIDPSAGAGVPLSAYRESVPTPRMKPSRPQTVNRVGKGDFLMPSNTGKKVYRRMK
jgi:hypothetical protein